MKKYLPILRKSPFFKGLTDNEILSILLTETKVKSIDGGKMKERLFESIKKNAMAAAPVQMPATKVPLISLMEKQNW